MLPKLQVGSIRACITALLYLGGISTVFFAVGALRNHSVEYWYLLWNLFLAWLPLMFAYRLLVTLRHQPWSSWQGIFLSMLWLGFLPNSFYMVSDFIHLHDVARVDYVFDAVMFTLFILNGLLLGYLSLLMVHVALRTRLRASATVWMLGGILLLCSFAIYLGRDLRYNTWDVLVNPAGILFDVSDNIVDPTAHPQAFTTTLTFFVFLTSVYWVIWHLLCSLQRSPPRR